MGKSKTLTRISQFSERFQDIPRTTYKMNRILAVFAFCAVVGLVRPQERYGKLESLVSQAVKFADKDCNGIITQDEYDAWWTITKPTIADGMFRRMDFDQDDSVSPVEFFKYLGSIGSPNMVTPVSQLHTKLMYRCY